MMKYKQTIVIEYDLKDDDSPMSETDIEFCLGGEVLHLSTQKKPAKGYGYTDAGDLIQNRHY